MKEFLHDSELVRAEPRYHIHPAAISQNTANNADLLKDSFLFPFVQDTWTSMVKLSVATLRDFWDGKAEFEALSRTLLGEPISYFCYLEAFTPLLHKGPTCTADRVEG